jgi:hypothetical protein
MAPAARKAGSASAPASTRTPITISTAMAPKNASAGLSSATAPIIDNYAHTRRRIGLPLTYADPAHQGGKQAVRAASRRRSCNAALLTSRLMRSPDGTACARGTGQ